MVKEGTESEEEKPKAKPTNVIKLVGRMFILQ